MAKQLKIRKGDHVIVTAGKDKGKTGDVIAVNAIKRKILVSGVQMVSKAEKPNQNNESGGIVRKESYIDYSNVMLYSKKLKKGVRVSLRRDEKKVTRYSSKTDETFN